MLPDISSKNKVTSFDLFKIINSCREESGENKIRANDFSARIADELDGDDYETFVVVNPNKTETKAYRLTHRQCMLIGMRESKSVRRNVCDKLEEMSKPKLPESFSEALQLAANQAKQLEEQAPMIEVYDKLANRKNDVSTTTLAKQLGVSAIKLNRWLKAEGYKCLFKDYPAAKFADWFNVVSDVSDTGHEFTQCLITPLGQIEIAKRFNK